MLSKKIVLYIGDFKKLNGPSMVDVNLGHEFKKNGFKFTSFQASSKDYPALVRKTLKADVVHGSGVSFAFFVSLLFAKILRKKSTYTMHGSLEMEKKFRKVAFHRLILEKLILSLVDRIFPVSDMLGRDITAPARKIKPIPLGCNANSISISPDKISSVVCVGGGRAEKKHDVVCRVLQELRDDEGIIVDLHIFGEDGEHTEFLKSINFVNYHGFVQSHEVIEAMDKSFLFIIFSEYETFSLSVVDAMLSKCYIIMSDKVGIADYLELSQLLRIVRSREELKTTVHELYKIYELGVRVNETAHRLLDWKSVSDAYINEWIEIEKS
jgi:glycosyltransferase involved in cell wall biosynthesis